MNPASRAYPRIMRTPIIIAITIATIAAVSGCGGSDESNPTTAAPSAASTTVAAPAATGAGPVDRTADLLDANPDATWTGEVTAATATEPGRLEIDTTLVDPRSEGGSPESQTAIEICEAGVALLSGEGTEAPYVSVLESDGTTWVLYGHPMVPAGECGEV